MGFKETIKKNATIWFLSALLAAFLAGIGAYESVIRITGQTVVNRSDIEQSKKELTALNKEVRFLSLFLRYEQAKAIENKAQARDALDQYIERFIDEADKSESVVKIGKGSGKQTTITFHDGSRWLVPPDFRSAVLK